MSHYLPEGQELAVLKKLAAKVDKINLATREIQHVASQFMEDSAPSGFDSLNWSIDSDFALEGVRVNGTGRTNTLADFILGIRRIRNRRKSLGRELDRAVARLDKLLEQVEHIIRLSQLCPLCEGAEGKTIPPENHRSVSRWEDCYMCSGRGVMP